MTNPSTDELVRAAFTELRHTEQGRVIPPGVAAARRTVRRRTRAVTAAGAASAVVVLGIGYLATAVVGQADPDRGTLPGTDLAPSPPAGTPPDPLPSTEPPDPGATGDTGGQNEAEVEALDAVDFDTEDGQWLPGLSLNDSQNPPGSRYNTFFVDPGEPAWVRELFDTSDPRVQTESYLVQVWCGDEFGGSVTVTLRAGDTEVTTIAECAMTEAGIKAGAGEAVLAASSDHDIELALELAEAAWADGARPVLTIVAIPQGVDLPRRPGP
jgi:hypothetical protein